MPERSFRMPRAIADDPDARERWESDVPVLQEMGLLTTLDVPTMTSYCMAWSDMLRLAAFLRKHGDSFKGKGGTMRPRPEVRQLHRAQLMLRSVASEFGMTPSARTRMSPQDPTKRSQRRAGPPVTLVPHLTPEQQAQESQDRRFFG